MNPKRNWKQWLCKTFGDKQGVLWECESSCDGSKVSRPCHSFGLAVLGPSEESLRGVWTQRTRVEGCHVIKNRVWFVFVRATVGVRVRVIVGVGSEKYSWYAFRNCGSHWLLLFLILQPSVFLPCKTFYYSFR